MKVVNLAELYILHRIGEVTAEEKERNLECFGI